MDKENKDMASASGTGLPMNGAVPSPPSVGIPDADRPCTCHPDDRPKECQHLYALTECLRTPQAKALVPDALWEALASGFVAQSGKRYHSSDCATSCAPAMQPGPCDCSFESIGPWIAIKHYLPRLHGKEALLCGGTIEYDGETFPAARPFNGVAVGCWRDGSGWCGGYGSEYDAEYWHEPEWFMPLPETAQAIEARRAETGTGSVHESAERIARCSLGMSLSEWCEVSAVLLGAAATLEARFESQLP